MKQEPQQHPDELVPEDDAIIGRAFKWSLAVIVVAAAIVAGGVWALRTEPDAAPTTPQVVVAPEAVTVVAQAPAARFVDISRSAGVDFVHTNGATGDKLLPETMGSGCAFLDYDNDTDPDILLINATDWPDAAAPTNPTMALYRNDGGQFANVTSEAGLAVSLYGMGVALGDYDNDGDVDIYVTAVGPNRLFRNDDGRFSDVTSAAGVAGGDADWGTSAAFFDYDRDGDLDLFACNYVQWTRDIDFAVDYRLVGVGRAYGVPTNFQGTQSLLWRNEGDGRFSDVSESAGIHVNNPGLGTPAGKALGLATVDFDSDGWLDVLVANDTVANFLFHNQQDGTFKDIGIESGVAYDRMGNATGAMGVDVADFRNDNVLALGIGNFANEMTSLYMAGSDTLQFTDVAIVEGVGAPSRQALTFGLFFFDYDLDGRLDLLHCNGHLEEEINTVQPSQHYRQPGQLFWNAGPAAQASFVSVPAKDIGDLATPIVGRGAAYADIDGDGDLDVLLTEVGGPARLLRNDQNTGHHWLRVHLRATHGPAEAIGARLALHTADGIQRRTVMPTRSYLSQVELPVTFGLGTQDQVERLMVTWPDGSTQEIKLPGVDRQITIAQP